MKRTMHVGNLVVEKGYRRLKCVVLIHKVDVGNILLSSKVVRYKVSSIKMQSA